MALQNKSMYAILGILNLAPSTGYDIKKYCDQVLSGFWSENFGHIYPTLKRLSEEGLIETVPEAQNERKIRYQITEKGRQKLRIWFTEEIKPQPVRSELMLKLLFSSEQPKEDTIRMLENYKKDHEKSINKYKEMQTLLSRGIQEIPKERIPFYDIILRREILTDEAIVNWCSESIAILSN